MKKLIHLLVTLFTSVSFAASGTIPTKFNTDTVQFGHSGSVANHNLIYDFGLAGLNPTLAVDSATKTLKYNKNFFQIGAGTAGNESYAFNIGAGANNPSLRWNSSLSKLQFSNDGTIFKTINLGTDIMSGAATNGQVLTADGSGGTFFAAGSGGGGSKNYLSTVTTTNGTNVGNGNFETGTTSGWVLGNTSVSSLGLPTGTPTFGTGSDANLSFSAVTANRLAGTYSGAYVSTTPTVQGNFVSTVPFNIDSEDQAQVLSVKIYYSVVSGSGGADFSGTNSNSFGIAVYDVTAGAWVDSFAGNFGFNQNIGAGHATATFQTSITSTQYRFVLYNAHPTTTAINLVIDDVVVGPQTLTMAPSLTDSKPYIPLNTNFGPLSSVAMNYRQVGDSVEIQGTFQMGSPGAAPASISLPPGLFALITNGQEASVGRWSTNNGNSNTVKTGPLLIGPGGSYLFFSYDDTTSSISAQTHQNANSLGTATNVIYINARVPIAGWSSNTLSSSDSDTRLQSLIVANPTSVITASVADVTNYDPPTTDTHASFNSVTGIFTAPISGVYDISGSFLITGSFSTNQYAEIDVVGSNGITRSFQARAAAGVVYLPIPVVTEFNLSAGQKIKLQSSSNGSSTVFSAGGLFNHLNISKRSGPESIPASASVNAQIALTSNYTTTGPAPIKFDTVLGDTHNAYSTSTGLYTCPISGVYRLTNLSLTTAAGGFVTNVLKNGVSGAYLTSVSNTVFGNGSSTLKCLIGETLGVTLNSTATFQGSAAPGYTNSLYIEKVGN